MNEYVSDGVNIDSAVKWKKKKKKKINITDSASCVFLGMSGECSDPYRFFKRSTTNLGWSALQLVAHG